MSLAGNRTEPIRTAVVIREIIFQLNYILNSNSAKDGSVLIIACK